MTFDMALPCLDLHAKTRFGKEVWKGELQDDAHVQYKEVDQCGKPGNLSTTVR
jgi:hypothetical protein